MATSKLLQTPSIIQIQGSSIRVAHPSTQGNPKTYLRSPTAAAASSCSVGDNTDLANADQIILGTVGDPLTESVLINGAVTLGSALSIATTTAFAHDVDAEVTKVYERSVIIYGAATSGGSLTSIATVAIRWDKPFTEYTLLTTDTAYAYYVAKFTDGTTNSTASGYVIAAGVLYTAIEPFIQQALDITNSDLDSNLLTRDMCVRWAQDCQLAITQFTYQDPVTGRYQQKDWSWEVVEDKTSIALTQNENEYALSALTNTCKYPNSDKAIIDMRIGVQAPLRKREIDEYDDLMRYRPRTTVATQPAIGAITLVVADATELPTGGGTVYVGSDTVTYTAISTNTLTGIPASGTGSITSTWAVGTVVWQNITPGLPVAYTIFNGTIKLDRPISSTYVSQHLKIRYFYNIPRLTLNSDVTVIPFTNVFWMYIAAQIEKRKGNDDKAKEYMDMFNKQVLANALADMVPTTDEWTRHNYSDDFLFDGLNLNNSYYYYNSF
jgi:hypothetical protein